MLTTMEVNMKHVLRRTAISVPIATVALLLFAGTSREMYESFMVESVEEAITLSGEGTLSGTFTFLISASAEDVEDLPTLQLDVGVGSETARKSLDVRINGSDWYRVRDMPSEIIDMSDCMDSMPDEGTDEDTGGDTGGDPGPTGGGFEDCAFEVEVEFMGRDDDVADVTFEVSVGSWTPGVFDIVASATELTWTPN